MAVNWGEVYRARHRDLVRYLYRKTWSESRAEDLAQEAFARALGQEPRNPWALLFRIATNLARDEARTAIRRRRQMELVKQEYGYGVAQAWDPVEELESEASALRVRRALAMLSPRDREVLLLWDAGRSYAEIAAATDLAIGAIGTTLARARKRLVETYHLTEATDAASD